MLTKMMPSQRARRPRHDSKASRQDNETENQMRREDEVSLRFPDTSPDRKVEWCRLDRRRGSAG